MPMRRTLSFCLLLIICKNISARRPDTSGLWEIAKHEKWVKNIAPIMIGGETDSHRTEAAWRLYRSLDTMLHMPAARFYPFDSLKKSSVSILYEPKGAFRLFTFNLISLAGDFKQFGFIETRTKNESEVFPLLDTAKKPKKDFLKSELETSEWLGALYYGIVPYGKGKKKSWILIGFDGANAHSNKKILDVLWFDQGTPVFGKPVFLDGNQDLKPDYRVVFEFHNESHMLLRYEAKRKIIVLDELAPAFPEAVNDYYYYIPSGDYDYYKLNKKNFWVRENLEDLDLGQGTKPKGPTEKPKPEEEKSPPEKPE